MGRVVLPQLMNTIEKAIESKETLPINVYGTRGYGKSHIIAAVVVLLMKKKGGLPVLFLPQVRDMADSDPLPYLRAAALLTFASASDAQIMSDIEDCDSLSALTAVISKHQFILVADQLNSLKEDSRIADDKKKLVRNLLDTLGGGRVYVRGFSANNQTAQVFAVTQRSQIDIKWFGGFDVVPISIFIFSKSNLRCPLFRLSHAVYMYTCY